MRQSIANKLTLFTENVQVMKSDFMWQDNMTKRLTALFIRLRINP